MKLPIFRSLLGVVFAFLLTATLIASLQLLSARTGNAAVTSSIRAELKSGSVEFPSAWDGNLKTGIDTWTDCLVLSIATFGRDDFVSALTTANHVVENIPHDHPCNRLDAKLGGTSTQGQTDDYWRYWWGSAALLNIAIGIGGLTLPSYQTALKLSTYGAILLALCTAFFRYRRAALPLVPVAVALTFGFAIPLFGQSIAHAPGLIIGLLFLSGYMAAGIDRAPLTWQFAYAFVAGGVGFYFDLLNGDILAVLILFGLVRLLSILAFHPPTVPSPFTRLPTSAAVAQIMVGFVTGAAAIAVWRIVLRAILTGENLFIVLIQWHAQLSKFSSTNWSESQHVLSNNLPADQSLFHHWYYDLEVATFPYIGRHGTLLIYGLCALCYALIAGWCFSRRRIFDISERDTLLAAALVACIVPLWYGLFFVHALIHFFMMGRLLALFFSLAPAIALIISAVPYRAALYSRTA